MMKISNLFRLLWAFILVGCTTAMTTEEFDEWENAWRKAICDKYGLSLIDELEECNKLAEFDVDDTFRKCQFEAVPDSTDPASFMKAACEEQTAFEKYDECLKPHRNDETFLKEVEESIETLKCSIEVMKKYDAYNEDLEFKTRK